MGDLSGLWGLIKLFFWRPCLGSCCGGVNHGSPGGWSQVTPGGPRGLCFQAGFFHRPLLDAPREGRPTARPSRPGLRTPAASPPPLLGIRKSPPDDLVKFTSHEAEGDTNPLGIPVLESGQRTARAVSSSFFCNNSRLPREERFSSPQSDTLRL